MMTYCRRKWIVVCVVVAIMAMANAARIVGWLDRVGLIDLAGWVNRRFITGTAITVIAVLLWLLVDRPPMRSADSPRRCPVCDHPMFAGGRYCSHCGSRA